jgi:hypothetical protein
VKDDQARGQTAAAYPDMEHVAIAKRLSEYARWFGMN